MATKTTGKTAKAGKTTKSTKREPSGQSRKKSAKDIREAYLKELLYEGRKPASVFRFAHDLGISEAEFYTHFSSFEAIEEEMWQGFMEDTLAAIRKDENYLDFSVREKLLAFYYTHLEVLMPYRSYVVKRVPDLRKSTRTPEEFRSYKRAFTDFAKALVDEAVLTEEIISRPFLSDRYDKAFWVQLVFLLNFWVNDRSRGFENTDAAVEKAVRLSFNILGDNTLDSIVDFAKFLWQSK